MNRTPRKRHAAAVNHAFLVAMGLFLVTAMMVWAASPVPSNKPASYPAWWFERDVIKRADTNVINPAWPTNYLTSDDYATLNAGQLKTLASKAFAELQNKLSATNWQGATNAPGPKLSTLIQSWSTNTAAGDNYAVVNQGQLKNVAKSFYDVLGQAGYVSGLGLPPVGWTNGAYPWSSSTNSPDAYAAANIGQVKNLFSFDLTAPTGQLPTWWQNFYFSGTGISPAGDADLDGLSNLAEYTGRSNPRDFFNGTLPVLQKLSGDNQTGAANVVLPAPLVVKVINSGSSVLTNAPVQFSISGSFGQIATTGTGSFGSTMNVVTGTGGTAAVYLKPSGTVGAINQVQAVATSGTNTVSVVFSATSGALGPVLSIAGGNNQVGLPSLYLSQPLSVQVRSSGTAGTLLINEPVTFTVASGNGGLATTSSGTMTSGTLTVNTGSNGIASAFYQQSSGAGVTSTITAKSGFSNTVILTSRTTLSDGLWSRWKFDDGTGTVAAEATGLTASGSLVNGAGWTDGFDGKKAVTFSGSSQYVTMGDPPNGALDLGSDSFSIGFWVRYSEVPTSGNTMRIVSKGYSNWGAGYFVGIREGGKLASGMGTASCTQSAALLFRTTGTFNDNQWHHVAVVYNRPNATARIYVDGVAQALEKEVGTSGSVSGSIMSYSGTTGLSASGTSGVFTVSSYSGTSDFFAGGVDDVRIYRKALSGAEVFDIDSDEDGQPDLWEQAIVNADLFDEINSIADVTPTGNLDGDSLSNLDEWEKGLNPLDGSDAPGHLEILSGDEQTVAISGTASQPLEIKAEDYLDQAMIGASVRIRVEEGAGLIRLTGTGVFDSSVQALTDSEGEVSVELLAGDDAGGETRILCESDFSPSVGALMYTVGCLGIWNLDEREGVTGNDGSLFQRTAKLRDTSWVEGKIGSALHFTSTLHSLATVESSATTLNLNGGAFTVMGWIKTTQTGTTRLIGQGFFADYPGIALDMGVGGAGRISAAIGNPAGESVRITTTGTFNNGQWHHVAFVVNRVTGSAGIVVDGDRRSVQMGLPPAGTSATSVSVPSDVKPAGGQALVFGWEPGTGNYFNGDMDSIRLHRGALSDSEIENYATLAVDSDEDTLPDDWEQQIIDASSTDAIEDLDNVLPGEDFDGDGISNENEYLTGTSPIDFFNGKEPTVTIDSGDNQTGTTGVLLDQPLSIRITEQGRTLTNAPLSVIPADSEARVGFSGTSLSPTLNFRTMGRDNIFIRP